MSKITDLTAITTLAEGDLAPIVDVSDTTQASSGSTRKSTLTQIADFLKTRVETLTNKTLTSPKINEDVALTTSSSELNLLDGLTSSAAELNKLDGTDVTKTDFDKLHAVTASETELNQLDGITGKSGSDTTLITGTQGTDSEVGVFNSDGDLVASSGGWIPTNETWAYASASTFTISGDKREKYSAGMKLRYKQDISTYLEAYYRFESGALTTDSSGNTRTLTAIGSPSENASGKFGGAVTIATGEAGYSITDHADLKPTGAFSVGAWVKKNAGGAAQIFQSYSQNTSYAGIFLTISSGGIPGLYSGDNTGTTVTSDWNYVPATTAIDDNSWHYVIGTWDTQYLRIYVDGALENQQSWTTAPAYAATNYVRVGCRNNSGTNDLGWGGSLDDVFLFNGIALTSSDIKRRYKDSLELHTNKTRLDYAIISLDPTYSSPNTTVSIAGTYYYSLLNTTISEPYFSSAENPLGFPLTGQTNRDSWVGTPYVVADVCGILAGAADGNWTLLNDSGHEPINVASVSQSATYIRVYYKTNFSQVVTAFFSVDNVLLDVEYHAGGSVGLSYSDIYLYSTGTIQNPNTITSTSANVFFMIRGII